MQADYDCLYTSLAAIAGGDGAMPPGVPAPAPVEADAGDDDLEEGTDGAQTTTQAQPKAALAVNDVRLPRSAKKLARLLVQLRDEGYASFFE